MKAPSPLPQYHKNPRAVFRVDCRPWGAAVGGGLGWAGATVLPIFFVFGCFVGSSKNAGSRWRRGAELQCYSRRRVIVDDILQLRYSTFNPSPQLILGYASFGDLGSQKNQRIDISSWLALTWDISSWLPSSSPFLF